MNAASSALVCSRTALVDFQRYNIGVRFLSILVAMLLSTGLLAQAPPPSCPADRPVDDMIAEIHNQQSKKKNRNRNPLPEIGCIWGWCRDHSQTPPTIPNPPRAEIPTNNGASPDDLKANPCDEAMEKALDAAHNVDVGDFYFQDKKFPAALQRYQDASEEKPLDAAIHVRLGRVFEKLKEPTQALEQYKAALKLSGPQKWTDEAKAALERLGGHPSAQQSEKSILPSSEKY